MNIINKVSFLVLFVAILFTACDKENIDEIIPESPEISVDTVEVNPLVLELRSGSSDSISLECVKIPFPIDFRQASGNTITINSQAELDSAEMLTGLDILIDFVYPFEAEDDNGTIVIEDVEDLVLAIQSCGVTPSDCTLASEAHVLLFFNGLDILTLNKYVYEINYPVTLNVEGNLVVINSDEEYLPAVGGSPFDLLETDLVYPITITQFGRDIVLTSDNDVCEFYETLDEPCANKPAHIQFFFNEGGGVAINCAYFINYPVEIVSNGATIQIQSREDYLNELNSSPNAYDNIELVYPAMMTKFSDGQQINFEADADICQYLDNCR